MTAKLWYDLLHLMKVKKEKKVAVGIRLSESLVQWLRDLATREKRSIAAQVETILETVCISTKAK